MSSLGPSEPEQQQRALPAHATPDAEKPKGSWVRPVVVCLLIAAVAAFAIWKIRANQADLANNPPPGGGRGGGGGAGQVTPVQVATVQSKTMPIFLTALGSVTAYNTVTIKTRVDGQLTRVNFQEGQNVKQGDLLLQIDPRPYEATVAQAKGQLARDEANAANARAEAQRYATLYQSGVVSKESADTQASMAGQVAGSIEADKAAIQAAQVNLAYTSITAPINGVVGLRQVDPGNIVHAGDANGLLLITQVHPISCIFTIPEDQLPQVVQLYHSGKKLVVEAWDRSNTTKVADGTLLTIDNQIDQTTGTIELKAVFANANNALFPNQFVNIRLILEQRANSLVVPSSAVSTGANGPYAYLVHPGQAPQELRDALAATGGGGGGGRRRGGGGGGGNGAAAGGGANAGAAAGGGRRGGGAGGGGGAAYYVTEQPVKIALTEGTQVIIDSGLSEGQQVVTDGQEKLKPGSPVSIPRGVGGNRNGANPNENNGSPGENTIGASNGGISSNTEGNGSPGGVNPSAPTGSKPGGHAGQARGGNRGTAQNNGDNSGRHRKGSGGNGGGGQGQPQ